MGTLIAAVIIIALIFYALKDLLADKDFSAWTNIALTALILFTVILSIVMILHKPSNLTDAPGHQQPAQQEESAPAAPQTPEERAAQEQRAKEVVAEEYVVLVRDCEENAAPGTDCAQNAKELIIKKYGLDQDEWDAFYREAADTGLFDQARQKQNIE